MTVITCSNCGAKNRVKQAEAANLQPVCGRCGTALDTGTVDAAYAPYASAAYAGRPIIVGDETFEREVLGARGVPILLDCWAPWCGPCRMIAPVLDELAAESKGRYIIAKLNVDDNPRTASRFDIRSIPTMLIFKNGALVDRIVGAAPKQTIAAKLS